jgi:hypothetical protein
MVNIVTYRVYIAVFLTLIPTNSFVGLSNIQLCDHCIYLAICGHFNNDVDGLFFTEFSVRYGYFRKFLIPCFDWLIGNDVVVHF